jgi:hypothetical protein
VGRLGQRCFLLAREYAYEQNFAVAAAGRAAAGYRRLLLCVSTMEAVLRAIYSAVISKIFFLYYFFVSRHQIPSSTFLSPAAVSPIFSPYIPLPS